LKLNQNSFIITRLKIKYPTILASESLLIIHVSINMKQLNAAKDKTRNVSAKKIYANVVAT